MQSRRCGSRARIASARARPGTSAGARAAPDNRAGPTDAATVPPPPVAGSPPAPCGAGRAASPPSPAAVPAATRQRHAEAPLGPLEQGAWQIALQHRLEHALGPAVIHAVGQRQRPGETRPPGGRGAARAHARLARSMLDRSTPGSRRANSRQNPDTSSPAAARARPASSAARPGDGARHARRTPAVRLPIGFAHRRTHRAHRRRRCRRSVWRACAATSARPDAHPALRELLDRPARAGPATAEATPEVQRAAIALIAGEQLVPAIARERHGDVLAGEPANRGGRDLDGSANGSSYISGSPARAPAVLRPDVQLGVVGAEMCRDRPGERRLVVLRLDESRSRRCTGIALAACISATTADESTPPESSAPSGTSAIIRARTAASSSVSSAPTASSKLPETALDRRLGRRLRRPERLDRGLAGSTVGVDAQGAPGGSLRMPR